MRERLGSWIAVLWNWTKLFGSSLAASFWIAIQVILFFTVQEIWKDWVNDDVTNAEFSVLMLSVVLMHAVALPAVLLFTSASQNLLKAIFSVARE